MKLPRWTREPLVHFLAAGAALFALFGLMGEDVDPASRSITVTQEDRARLALQWQQTISRPPTDAELDSLTEQFIREEVLYREALRLGLDRDDGVVRKRMATKMDYLAASAVETAQPSEATLQAWLEQYPTRFAADARFTFDQLYFADKAQAEAALARLKAGASLNGIADAISLPGTVKDMERSTVSARFGAQFAAGLDPLAPGQEWHGPLLSGFGWHLVRLRGKQAGAAPALADVRQQVENDWRNATTKQRREQAYKLLRDAYAIDIER